MNRITTVIVTILIAAGLTTAAVAANAWADELIPTRALLNQ